VRRFIAALQGASGLIHFEEPVPRADLLALSLEDLVALTNRGTVKRAQREVDENEIAGELSESPLGRPTPALYLRSFDWEKLHPPVLIDEFAELREVLVVLPPSCLGSRGAAAAGRGPDPLR
jgi:hypothetical protein